MSELGDTISDQIKKAREAQGLDATTGKAPDAKPDAARQEAWATRIKRLLGYGNNPAEDDKT